MLRGLEIQNGASMKFFKHFTDAHRGKSLKPIRRKFGMAGIGMWWTLVELCAEKLDKDESESFTEAHCAFEFDRFHLASELGTKQVRLENILGSFSDHSLIESESSGNIIRIKMPKLLECLDRDSRRARTERGQAAPKIKNKIKNKSDHLNLDWRKAAGAVLEMTKRYGNWSKDEAEVRDTIGDSLFDLATRAGVHKMRMLPPNQYLISNIAGMLKDANDQLQLKGVS